MAETQHPTSERPRLAPAGLRVMLVTAAIAAGAALVGVAGGLVWAALAPRALFMVSAPGVAYVVHPETTAFIAADGWFSVVAAVGGVIIGAGGYLAGVRRHGPVPVAGILAGATAAAFLAAWIGGQAGLGAFRHQLAAAKAGALIRQPVVLGAHGALAFWPLAAGAAVGIIELIAALADRRRQAHPGPAGQVPLAAGRDQEADRDLR
ncbi:MAG TPA: hypothetical protein VFX25_24500 [Streptosporangiaceae bacterium]|nr:hypothetical protein [Streptosporangiaceae bacterium]